MPNHSDGELFHTQRIFELSCVRTELLHLFILVPPNFDPSPDFREAITTAAALSSALEVSRPKRVVYLSTIGAQASRSNLLSQHTIIEQELRKLALPITFLRPGWFMENSARDVAPA